MCVKCPQFAKICNSPFNSSTDYLIWSNTYHSLGLIAESCIDDTPSQSYKLFGSFCYAENNCV
jgi:hypothetical protein